MNRSDLYDTLFRLRHALAVKDVVPALQCFRFDGESVTTFDDVVALSDVCPVEIDGCVPGKPLLTWLSSSRAKTVDPSALKSGVRWKSGRSSLTTPLMPPEAFPFDWGAVGRGLSMRLSDDVLEALKRCAVSMGYDPAHGYRMGVTAEFHGDTVTFWSTDNFSVTRSVSAAVMKKLAGKAVILSPRFVELLLSLAKKTEPKYLRIGDKGRWSMITFEGDLRLWAKTIPGPRPQQFETVIGNATNSDSVIQQPVPQGLEDMIKRMLAVLSPKTAVDKVADLQLEGGKLVLSAQSAVGRVKDQIKYGDKQCTMRGTFAPALIKRVLPFAERMAILPERCLYFSGENYEHIIAYLTHE